MKRSLRVFDPESCKSDDYKIKFPELARDEDFNDLSTKALIMVWWYANPTSPMVRTVRDDKQRIQRAIEKSEYSPSKTELDNILRLNFPETIAKAIDRMGNIDPSARAKSYMMIEKIMNEFDRIIDSGIDGFVTKTARKSGDEEVYDITYDNYKYVVTSAKIADTIPTLIRNMEEGFGVTFSDSSKEDEDYMFDDTFFDHH